MTEETEAKSTTPATPGQLIQRLLRERGWNQRTLALAMDAQPAIVNRLALDKRPVDAFAALMLGEAFGVPPERFLELQQAVDLAKARSAHQPNDRVAARASVFNSLPVAEMATRGWISPPSIADSAAVERELTRYFGVERLEEIQAPRHAAKKTNVGEAPSPAQMAWLYRVKAIAAELMVPRYSPAAVRHATEKLKDLRLTVADARKAPRILAECGIRFVIVESLSSAKIDGVCFWLNDMAPVIGMTLRHDRIDNFWFVLRHEIEHVLRGHGRESPVIDVELTGGQVSAGVIADEERIANEAASDFCVPKPQMDRFYSVKEPYFSERDILGFAATLRVHPGLVVGQLQKRSGRFDRFRSYLSKVRQVVTPEVAVDGWGTVYPLDNEPRGQNVVSGA